MSKTESSAAFMLIFLAALCGIIEAIFTALEVALGAVSRARLRALSAPFREGKGEEDAATAALPMQRALLALKISERPDRLALLFLTVTSLSLWAAASFLTWESLAQEWPSFALPLALVVLLFVAEVLPLQIAARHAEMVALRGAPLVALALKLLSPVLWILGGIAYGVARLLGSGPNPTPQVTQSELRTALATAEEEGVIESEERAMIEGAMDFRDTVVREVMMPRVDIIAVSADATLWQTLDLALREGHSRLLVFEATLDKVVGILAMKDLLPHLKDGHLKDGHPDDRMGQKVVRDVMRPAFFVPETKKIAATLEELRRQRTLLAVVVDADGGTAGLVTLEDLLEELVGEIQDEYDVEEPPLRAATGEEKAVWCDATTPVREFGKFWSQSFGSNATLRGSDGAPAESGQSLAALALELFENVPTVGDTIATGEALVATPDIRASFALDLEVTRMDGPRIEEVKIGVAPVTNAA